METLQYDVGDTSGLSSGSEHLREVVFTQAKCSLHLRHIFFPNTLGRKVRSSHNRKKRKMVIFSVLCNIDNSLGSAGNPFSPQTTRTVLKA